MTTPNLSPSRSRRRLRPLRKSAPATPLLSRPLSLGRINLEVLAYAALALLSLGLHLWGLGKMAMHHDESLHAWFSWKFFTGRGGFTCGLGTTFSDTYCYNPTFHGPTLYLLTYVSYFLFGVSEATARLPMALAGVGLVASCWMLRPLVGRRAALLSAVLLLLSPTILYFTRFARHDALALLWTFWLMVGLFRYMRGGKGRWLYLSAASLALLWATHELVFIIIFIAVTFLVQRWLWEKLPNRIFVIGSGLAMAVSGVLMLFNPTVNLPTATGQEANVFHFGGIGLIGFMTLLLGQIISLRWSTAPLVRHGLGFRRDSFYESRARARTFWIACGVFVAVFVICFSTFFTYPRGILDGLIAGLAYWAGTQQTYARGDQPWFYYFMQLGIYELLPVLLTFAGLGAWLARLAWRKAVVSSPLWDEDDAPAPADQPAETLALSPLELETPAVAEADPNPLTSARESLATDQASAQQAALDQNPLVIAGESEDQQRSRLGLVPASAAAASEPAETINDLWVGFVFYWFFLAFTVFSWAGEKMPWLTIHMSLPAVLAGAWALSSLTRRIDWEGVRTRWGWLIVPLVGGAVVLLLAASAQISAAVGADQAAQQSKIGGGMLVFMAALVGSLIWQLGRRLDSGTTLRMVALGFVAMLGLYTVRSAINASYRQPDVPVEFLVYTQTAPDVPLIVKEAERIAVNQNRTTRSVADPTGGHSMKILLSAGDPASGNSEGSLRQPLDWYLRDWTNVQWRDKNQIATLAEADLDAPIAIFARSNMAPDTQQKLEQAGYVEVYTTYHNWWFPEWSTDGNSTYKELLYDPKYGCDPSLRGQRDVNGRSLFSCTAGGIGILTWPLRPSNWNTLREYMLSRKLPAGADIGGREMVVFMRREVAPTPGDGNAAAVGGSGLLKLVSEGSLSGDQPTEPRGMATGPDGSVYVADAPSNRILVYQPDGTTRSISGTGPGTLLEPSGVAVDASGNVYVADTWNARITKFDSSGNFLTSWGSGEEKLNAETNKVLTRTGGTAEGNAAKPLGFFGPRNVAVDANGHVFIADTGNKRIVVTDDQGQFIGQIGTAGAAPGQFNEPIGLAVDATTNSLIVGDTWNGRVQIFPLDASGLPSSAPSSSWVVPGWKADTYLDPFLAVSSEGKIVVAVPERSTASLYDMSGRALISWGGEGTDEASLNRPSGIAFAPDGSVYIAEKGNSRIQRWVLPRVR